MNHDFVTFIPFALLLVAAICLWFSRTAWIAVLIAAVVAGYFTGALTGTASLWIALLGASAWLYALYKARAGLDGGNLRHVTAGVAFGLFAIAMGLALFPGFPRTTVIDGVVLSPGALPYSLGLGFPKVVGGIFIIGFIHGERLRSGRELGAVLARAAPVFGVTAVAVMALTLALGYVRFDPKWNAVFFLWAPANLFFTCLSEEAFFRGFLQRELSQIGANRRLASILALAVAAVLFGLVHLAGGWKYALAATLAGAGYGWAYLRTQRIEAAMAVHFALNATHFLLFTYPALA